jgi:ABC-type branched-subunit amino acid transport system ATPase component
MTRSQPVYEATEVVSGYGSTPTIHGISLVLDPGQVLAIIGANGSGKSTLLKALAGQLPIKSGRTVLAGTDVTGLRCDELVRRGVGYVPQLDDTFAALTVHENLEMGGYCLRRRAAHLRMSELFERLPMIGRLRQRHVASLSGGERKIVAIGRALMLDPKVLLIDEPTASLTPELSHLILKEVVRKLADDGAGVILVEQKAIEALAVSDWVHVLGGGRVTLSDTPKSLQEPARLAAAFFGSAPAAAGHGTARRPDEGAAP